MKYFKLDKDNREIIIDKYKKYNVNVDILNLIIDLKCENDRLNNIINELEKYLEEESRYNEYKDVFYREDMGYVLDKLKELKDSDK